MNIQLRLKSRPRDRLNIGIKIKDKLISRTGNRRLGIAFKLLVPILGIVIVSNLAIGSIGYSIQKKTINGLLEEMVSAQVENFDKTMVKGELSGLKAEQFLKDYLLKLSSTIAMDLENSAESELQARIDEIKRETGIDKIRIIDEDGVSRIAAGESGEMDFKTDDQRKAYLEGVENPNFYLVQGDVETDSGENMYFAGKSIANQKKVVQIGVSTANMKGFLNKSESAELAKDIEFGKGGSIMVVNPSGEVLYSKDSKYIGKNLEELEWGSEILKGKSGSLDANLDGQSYFMSYNENFKREKIVAMIPSVDYVEAVQGFASTILLLTVVMIAVTLVVIVAVTKVTVLKRLKKTGSIIAEIEKGNLHIDIESDKKDEIGDLVGGLSIMKEEIKDIVKGITNYSKSVHNMSAHLVDSSDRNMNIAENITEAIEGITEGSNLQVEKIKEIVEKLNQLSDDFDKIVKNIMEMEQNAEHSRTENEEGKIILSGLREIHDKSMASNEDLKKKMSVLKENSRSIQGIVEVINRISSQTNLLSLNANIEAARAGEFGKSFGVVAEEIRKLSEETFESSKQIEDIVYTIIMEVGETDKSISEVSSNLENSRRELQKTIENFESITDANNHINENISNLQGIILDTDESTKHVVEIVEDVEQISEENARLTADISGAVEDQREKFRDIDSMTKDLKEISIGLNGMIENFNC